VKTFQNEQFVPVRVACWQSILEIFAMSAGASISNKRRQFAGQHFHTGHCASADRTLNRITTHAWNKCTSYADRLRDGCAFACTGTFPEAAAVLQFDLPTCHRSYWFDQQNDRYTSEHALVVMSLLRL
jgi:hypothetical protein